MPSTPTVPVPSPDERVAYFGKVLWDREGKMEGQIDGSHRRCQMESCNGLRILVRWPDGNKTWPCTKGLVYDEAKKAWRIG